MHRRAGEADIYFIRNTLDRPIETAVLLRVKDETKPEIFHADSRGQGGEPCFFPRPRMVEQIVTAVAWGAGGSVFVIFQH